MEASHASLRRPLKILKCNYFVYICIFGFGEYKIKLLANFGEYKICLASMTSKSLAGLASMNFSLCRTLDSGLKTASQIFYNKCDVSDLFLPQGALWSSVFLGACLVSSLAALLVELPTRNLLSLATKTRKQKGVETKSKTDWMELFGGFRVISVCNFRAWLHFTANLTSKAWPHWKLFRAFSLDGSVYYRRCYWFKVLWELDPLL